MLRQIEIGPFHSSGTHYRFYNSGAPESLLSLRLKSLDLPKNQPKIRTASSVIFPFTSSHIAERYSIFISLPIAFVLASLGYGGGQPRANANGGQSQD